MCSRGYINFMTYYIDKDINIVKRICDGEVVSPEKEEMVVYSVATFTKGACIEPYNNHSPIDIGSVATLLDHVSGTPCMFFKPNAFPLTRNLKVEFFEGAHESIKSDELSLCTSKITKMEGRKFGIESIFYQRGKPYAKSFFFGVQTPTQIVPDPQVAYKELLERCEKAKPINYGALFMFANEIEKANGDSRVLIELNREKTKEFTDERIIQYANDIISKGNGNISVIAGSGINGRPSINGDPAVLHHRVFYNKENKKYSAAVHFSIFTEGAPNIIHGGSTAEAIFAIMNDVSDHLSKTTFKNNKCTFKLKTIDLDYLKSIRLDAIVEIPDVQYTISVDGKSIDYRMELMMDGVITNKLLTGKIEVLHSVPQQQQLRSSL